MERDGPGASARTWIGSGVVVGLLAVAGLAIVLRTPSPAVDTPASDEVREATLALDSARPARVVVDEEKGEVVNLHGPVDLLATGMSDPGMASAHGAHASHAAVFPTVTTVEVPVDGYFHGFYADLTDREGRPLDGGLLHHVNVIDPDRRELFAPISMRVAAAGRETGHKSVPPLLFGSPLRKGQRLVIHTMLHNGTPESHEDVVLRFHFRFRPEEAAGPVVTGYPFWVDVRFPAGDKTFDLPPGRSTRSYEATRAVAVRLLALSGHMHEHATGLRFEDITTGEVVWEAAPVLDDKGNLERVPTGRPYLHGGEVLSPEHTYRLSVEYDNPTGRTIPDGGMGSIGGVVVPLEDEAWPTVDPTSELYRLDRRHYFRDLRGTLEELRAAEVGMEGGRGAHVSPSPGEL